MSPTAEKHAAVMRARNEALRNARRAAHLQPEQPEHESKPHRRFVRAGIRRKPAKRFYHRGRLSGRDDVDYTLVTQAAEAQFGPAAPRCTLLMLMDAAIDEGRRPWA